MKKFKLQQSAFIIFDLLNNSVALNFNFTQKFIQPVFFFIFFISTLVSIPVSAAVTFRSAESAQATIVAGGGTIVHEGAGNRARLRGCGNISPSIPTSTSTIPANDILIAIVVARENNAMVSPPAGWNQYFSDSYSGGADFQTFIFWRFYGLAAPSTIFSQSGTCDSFIGRISRFSGVDTTAPFDPNVDPIAGGQWSKQNSGNLNTSTGSVSTTTNNAMIVVASSVADNRTVSQAGGWSESFDSTSSWDRDVAISLNYQLQTTSGLKRISDWSWDLQGPGSDPNYAAIFALRPAPTTGTSTLVINKPSGTTVGDVMLASVSTTPNSINVLTAPTGWTLLPQVNQPAATSSTLKTYYKVARSIEPSSYSWTFDSVGFNGAVGGIASFIGVDNATPIDANTGNTTASSTSHTAPDITTTLDGGMLVTSHEYTSSGTWTEPVGMTEMVDIAYLAPDNAAGISIEMNYEERLTAGATGSRTATASSNADAGAAHSISLKPSLLSCYTDDFNRANGSPGADWVVSSNSGGNPVIENNRLRLTNTDGDVATMATLQQVFPGAGNRIEVEFDHYAYGGTGADGIAVILSDFSIAPVPGGYGGSLGYAQRTGINGFAGGWLGVGIDEYGNFSNATEGRIGGIGRQIDSISIRGSGSGTSGYVYHAGTTTLATEVDNNGAASPPHRYRIIIDHSNGINAWVSVERDTTGSGSNYVTWVAPYDAKAQAGQAAVPTTWILSYTGSTGGATNIHEIDSLRVCATAQASASGPDHFAIDIGAGNASTCSARNITITAEDISNATLTSYTGSINLTTSTSHGDWAQGTATNVPNDGATPDDGAASYSFDTNDAGIITLTLENTHADDLTITVSDPALSVSSTSSVLSFRDNAFVITDENTTPATDVLVAGRDETMKVTLWRRDPNPLVGDCNIATGYAGNKDLKAWLTVDAADHPAGATVPTIGALSLPAAVPGANNLLALNFTAGEATFNLSTTDVGKYVLNLRDDTSGFIKDENNNPLTIDGSSNSLTAIPFAIGFTNIRPDPTAPNNPGGTASSGNKFISAGTDFEATLAGYLWNTNDDNLTNAFNVANDGIPNDSNGDGIPDADVTNNGKTLRFTWDTTLTPSAPFTPTLAGSVLGSLTVTNPLTANYSTGEVTVTNFNYSEVGSMTLKADVQNYLGTALADFTGYSAGVGRFYPDHFTLVPGGILPSCAGNFTYMDQLFTNMSFNIIAKNGRSPAQTTTNYDDKTRGYSVGNILTEAENANDGTDLSSRLSTPNVKWEAGDYAVNSSTEVFIRGALGLVDGPFFTLAVGIAVSDADGAIIPNPDLNPTSNTDCTTTAPACTSVTLATTDVRFGRVVLPNAYGSELVDLKIPMANEYFDGSKFITNLDDSCATNPNITLTLSNPTDTVTIGDGTLPRSETCIWDDGATFPAVNISGANGCFAAGPVAPPTDKQFISTPVSGIYTLYLKSPDTAATFNPALPIFGQVTIQANNVPSYLQYDWDEDGTHDNAPNPSVANFGLYRGDDRIIYWREVFQ